MSSDEGILISLGCPAGSETTQGSAQLVEALREGNAALKEANSALRELVTSLQSERRLLIDKNNELEAKFADLQLSQGSEVEQSVQGQVLSSHDLANLPQEIVLRICLAVIPGKDHYDSSILAGPRSPWLQSLNTRKALTLICRTWNGPASEALYADIVFRRMGQISALARTFRASAVVNAPHRVKFVKRIYMNSCAVMLSCEKVITEDLTYLLRHCTELESFAFRPHPGLEYPDAEPRASLHMFNPPWILDADEPCVHALKQRCGAGLQELVFQTPFTKDQYLHVLGIVAVGVHLKSLTLGAIPILSMSTNLAELGAQPADLPNLEQLQIHLRYYTDQLAVFICDHWTLPRLKRLTLMECDYLPETLLVTHGLHLEYLHIVPDRRASWYSDSSPTDTPLDLLGQWCPLLEHFVMPYFPAFDPLCTLDVPSLRYLDLWGPPHKRRVVELWGEMGRASSLPELVRVRLLPMECVTRLPVDLPRICHPEDVGADEVLVHSFPGMRVLQTSWALLADAGPSKGVSFVDESELEESGSEEGGSWFGSEGPWAEGGDEEEGAEEREGGEGDEGDVAEDYDDGTSWVSESDGDGGVQDATSSVADGDCSDATDDEESESLEFDRDGVLERFTASQMEDFLFDDVM